jgi:hypothetical protein
VFLEKSFFLIDDQQGGIVVVHILHSILTDQFFIIVASLFLTALKHSHDAFLHADGDQNGEKGDKYYCPCGYLGLKFRLDKTDGRTLERGDVEKRIDDESCLRK